MDENTKVMLEAKKLELEHTLAKCIAIIDESMATASAFRHKRDAIKADLAGVNRLLKEEG